MPQIDWGDNGRIEMLGYQSARKFVGEQDQRFAEHLQNRATAERQSAVADIKAKMQAREGNPGTAEQISNAGYGDVMDQMYASPLEYGSEWHDTAEQVRAARPGWQGPGLEGAAQGMADSRMARYGVMAGAAATVPLVGEGISGMTAGAQKLGQIMGLLQEAEQTDVARDQPLTS